MADANGNSFDFRTLVGDDGKFVQGWQGKLPEDVRRELGESKYFDSIESPVALIKSTHGLSKMAGRSLVPGKEAPADEWEKVLAQAPVPGEGQTYGLNVDGITDAKLKTYLSERGAVERMERIFKRAGLPSALAGRVATAWLHEFAEERRTLDEHAGGHRTRLEGTLGGKEAYDGEVTSGRQAVKDLYGKDNEEMAGELMTLFDAVGIADHPLVSELFGLIARRINPGVIVGGGPSGGRAKSPLASLLPNTAKAIGVKA
jgi:hypothetical protein